MKGRGVLHTIEGKNDLEGRELGAYSAIQSRRGGTTSRNVLKLVQTLEVPSKRPSRKRKKGQTRARSGGPQPEVSKLNYRANGLIGTSRVGVLLGRGIRAERRGGPVKKE